MFNPMKKCLYLSVPTSGVGGAERGGGGGGGSWRPKKIQDFGGIIQQESHSEHLKQVQ